MTRRGEKLIRDRVPVDDGGTELRPAFQWELLVLLSQKLEEEAEEVRGALDSHLNGRGDLRDVIHELADVVEVARAIAGHCPGGWEEVERTRAVKLAERGGFAAGRRYAYPPS